MSPIGLKLLCEYSHANPESSATKPRPTFFCPLLNELWCCLLLVTNTDQLRSEPMTGNVHLPHYALWLKLVLHFVLMWQNV